MRRNTAIPAKYPTKAIHRIFLRYQPKVIFSIPIATTPAAEPMINILPPVPAQYARKCQSWLSAANSVNIPRLAATRGTLSITAEAKPNKTINKSSDIVSFKIVANTKSKPSDSNAATAIKIPKKNNILGNSILVRRYGQDFHDVWTHYYHHQDLAQLPLIVQTLYYCIFQRKLKLHQEPASYPHMVVSE